MCLAKRGAQIALRHAYKTAALSNNAPGLEDEILGDAGIEVLPCYCSHALDRRGVVHEYYSTST